MADKRVMRLLRGVATTALWGGGTVFLREYFEYLDWTKEGKRLYLMAEAYARRRGRPLLVVGKPIFKDHG